MKIILFGGSGFVGRHLVRRLARDGHETTVATRYAPACRALAVVPRVRIRQLNPYDLGQLERAMDGHEVAVNLVGILNERGFGGRGFHRVHVELVEMLLNACMRTGVEHFIHMSALNAGRGESHYLRTRGEAEALISRLQHHGRLRWSIFKPATIFGPDDSFLNRFAGLLKISPVLPLARPRARFAPVFVGDVAEAFARVISDPSTRGHSFELCGPEIWMLKELVEWVRDQLGLRRIVIGLPDWAGRMQAGFFDFVPGKPFSSDNFKSLKLDTVCTNDGFARLGIEPWSMSQLAPTWLADGDRQHRYRQYRRNARRER